MLNLLSFTFLKSILRLNIMGKKCRGFSIIEFLIVIGIMAILASIAFPSIKLYINLNQLNFNIFHPPICGASKKKLFITTTMRAY
ncbi:MAG: hypothetical protein C0190_05275 [Thermodesulfobacterium geofontis]|uniref:Prepilin-type N-terminal cleavage/methylation domain-containing protein n=1 Tax=Thermodesulfobacterium geofontis TaxID=1295609 RepID=A0A2N7PMS8_9BACT|nr:MAG: hypothetical protein C0190_05275 [Thermodesulfobacterium geofontis]